PRQQPRHSLLNRVHVPRRNPHRHNLAAPPRRLGPRRERAAVYSQPRAFVVGLRTAAALAGLPSRTYHKCYAERQTEGSAMDAGRSAFWDDLASDLEDPEFLREYVAESIRIATIDRIVNQL